jgi:hypothetical protein
MGRHAKHGGCSAIDPEGAWPLGGNITNAQGCASLAFDQDKCAQVSECKWIEVTSHTPEAYDAQIRSLRKELGECLERREVDCSRAKAFKKNTTECKEAELCVRHISSTFKNIAGDLSGDIERIEKAIAAVDVQIDRLEKENASMIKKLDGALDVDAGSRGMIEDAQLLYNQELVGNRVAMAAVALFFTAAAFAGGRHAAEQAASLASRSAAAFTSRIPGLGS